MIRAVAACTKGGASQDDQNVDHGAGHRVADVLLAALCDGLIIDSLQDALDQDERAAEDCAVRLEHCEGCLDDARGILSFRLVIRLKDVQIVLIEEGVAGSDGERKPNEEEVDVKEEHRLPDSVGLALRLLFRSQL